MADLLSVEDFQEAAKRFSEFQETFEFGNENDVQSIMESLGLDMQIFKQLLEQADNAQEVVFALIFIPGTLFGIWLVKEGLVKLNDKK